VLLSEVQIRENDDGYEIAVEDWEAKILEIK
jgi:hypothetical protein